MLGVILIDRGNGEEALQATVRMIQESAGKREVLIASPGTGRMPAALRQAVCSARSDMLLLLNGSTPFAPAQLGNLISAMERSTAAVAYAPLEIGDHSLDLPALTVDNLVNAISSNPRWPVLAVAGERSLLMEMEELNGESYAEIMANILVRAAADNRSVAAASYTLAMENEEASLELCHLSNQALARILNGLIAACNIEDLFPRHAWEVFGEESAAASYHALAALFLRFGDAESARECLTFSDSLEDSPRSLALKALISLERGETLGAVANLVSSLQQYENRKKDSERKHYLRFSPINIEAVTLNLNKGLSALNNQDNHQAAQHFAAAVFNFDTFYREFGVDKLSK
jgi:hypothetical protein